jgi:hypothetical protein
MTASQLSIQSFGRGKKVGFCAAFKGYPDVWYVPSKSAEKMSH